jgi:hypothetical protein
MLSTTLKTAGLAALIGLASMGGASAPAAAATWQTRCYGDDCYRVRCNNFGYDCRRIEYLGDVGYVRYRDRMVCDADGDNCHMVRTRIYNYDSDDDDFYGD